VEKKNVELELEVGQLKKNNIDLSLEIGLLKKQDVKLEHKLESIVSTSITNVDGDHLSRQNAVVSGNSRDFLPRSCFEIKATNPSAQSGLYFIDPDGQINGDDPVQAYCDMDTSIIHIIDYIE